MVSDSRLKIRFYDDAIIPAAEPSDDALKLRLGGFRPDGEPLDGFRLERFYGTSGNLTFRESTRAIEGDITYGGFFGHHFGHFLLETLSRLWWLRRAPNDKILWHSWNKTVHSWQREIFDLACITAERFVFVDETVSVRNITVADPGYVIGMLFHPAQVAAMELIQFHPPSPGKNVWLSRSALPANLVHFGGELAIQEYLRAQGWIIMHPETHSLAQKISLLSDAETISGFEASSFHVLMLARDCGAKIKIVARGPKLHPNYAMIAEAKGLHQTVLSPAMEAASDKHGKPIKNVKNVAQVLDFVCSS